MDDRCYRSERQSKGARFRLQSVILAVILMCLSVPFLLVVPVLASNITDADFYGRIQIVSNTTDAYNECINFTLSTQGMINSYFLNSVCNNSAVRTPGGVDIYYMPAPGTTNQWIIFIPAISENSTMYEHLYTGGGDMGSQIAYFPGTAGMSTNDSATLEIGDNFTVTMAGFVNTTSGSAKNLIYKSNAFRVYVVSASTIRAAILSAGVTNETLRPNGAGDETNIANVTGGPATHWQAVGDNNTTTLVRTTNTSYERDFYQVADSTNFAQINNITVCFTISDAGSSNGVNATPWFKISGIAYNGTEQSDNSGSWVTKSQIFSTSPATNTTWTWSEVNSMQLGISIKGFSGTYGQCADVWIIINFNADTETKFVDATVASGQHTVAAGANGTNLTLYIDGSSANSTALSGASVPNNNNTWYYCQNSAFTYLNNLTISIAGVTNQSIVWQNSQTLFSDATGKGHHAYPTFRTTGTNGNITAALIDFGPISTSELSSYSVEGGGNTSLLSSAPAMPAEFEAELNTVHLPGASFVNNALSAADIPQALFWFPVCFGLAALFGFIAYGFTNSLLVQAVISAFFMFFFSLTGGGIIPWWSAFIFVIEAFAVILARKQVSVG